MKKATITKHANGEGRFIRQSAGRGQHGHVIVKIEPNERGKGVEITSEVSSGTIPAKFIKPVTDGVREALDGGVAIGNPTVDGNLHPIVDIVVRIVGGSFDETASSELAFRLAGIFAIKDAMKKADAIILE
jgi:elongation factor G